MTQRDSFLDASYWDLYIPEREAALHAFEDRASATDTQPTHRRRLRYTIFRERLELLIARYSRGEDISNLRASFPDVVAAFEAYHREPEHEAVDLADLDSYIQALWLVSLALLLDQETGTIERLAAVIGNEGRDALYERLVAVWLPSRMIPSSLLHPRPYEPLHQSLNAEGPKRDKLIEKFLKGYYSGMRRAYWHDRHLRPENGFFGYWCFELAACMKAFDIPDEPFARHVYYPRDLVQ